jgi:hypothetical protein
MPRPVFRFSIRRWIVLVATFAMVLGAGVAARSWYRVHARLISAQQDYARSVNLYDEGRVSCLEVAFRSRCVMNAECELAYSKGARVSAASAHCRRLQSLRDEEARQLAGFLDCHWVGHRELEELGEILIEAKAMMAPE